MRVFKNTNQIWLRKTHTLSINVWFFIFHHSFHCCTMHIASHEWGIWVGINEITKHTEREKWLGNQIIFAITKVTTHIEQVLCTVPFTAHTGRQTETHTNPIPNLNLALICNDKQSNSVDNILFRKRKKITLDGRARDLNCSILGNICCVSSVVARCFDCC